jgi:hypothetical protein
MKVRALFLLAAALISGCDMADHRSPDVQARNDRHKAAVDGETRLLRHVATAANEFGRAFGCAPGAPTDLLSSPTDERLADLDCTGAEDDGAAAVVKSHLPPEAIEKLSDIAFVRRWDGLHVIQYISRRGYNGAQSVERCTFLDAEYERCPSLYR